MPSLPDPVLPAQTQAALTLLAAVNELAGVDAFGCNEQFRPLLKPVRIPEDHLGERRAAARIMDDVLWAEAE